MSNELKNVLIEFQSDSNKFKELVINPKEFLEERELGGESRSALLELSSRARSLALFTPKTLNELSEEITLLPLRGDTGFDPNLAATFTDNFGDKYTDNDHYTDNYTNSDARISIDSWTKKLVLERGLDLSEFPGGFSGL